jgi:hypothetical protein
VEDSLQEEKVKLVLPTKVERVVVALAYSFGGWLTVPSVLKFLGHAFGGLPQMHTMGLLVSQSKGMFRWYQM